MHFFHAAWAGMILAYFITLILALFLTFGGRFNRPLFDTFGKAPILDIWVAALTWVPWVVGYFTGGAGGVIGVVLGQAGAMLTWAWIHEMANAEARRGPRIMKFWNRVIGRPRNHAGLWISLVAVPGFWIIRFTEIISWWPLCKLVGFPKYNQSEWITVSRQKFSGLVGHDLIWCLYCDWMTGVYSLGAEMLRNVESFWCPIRFYDGKKCENCKTDFPDIDNGWARADGTMADVVANMESKFGDGHREWFGHPARLTIKGAAVDTSGH